VDLADNIVVLKHSTNWDCQLI